MTNDALLVVAIIVSVWYLCTRHMIPDWVPWLGKRCASPIVAVQTPTGDTILIPAQAAPIATMLPALGTILPAPGEPTPLVNVAPVATLNAPAPDPTRMDTTGYLI